MWKIVEVQDLENYNITTMPRNGSCDHYHCDVERYMTKIWTIFLVTSQRVNKSIT